MKAVDQATRQALDILTDKLTETDQHYDFHGTTIWRWREGLDGPIFTFLNGGAGIGLQVLRQGEDYFPTAAQMGENVNGGLYLHAVDFDFEGAVRGWSPQLQLQMVEFTQRYVAGLVEQGADHAA